jgi:hypothetical protein
VTEFYVLKCKNEKKPRKGAIKCISNTGVFSSEKNADYRTACEPETMTTMETTTETTMA